MALNDLWAQSASASPPGIHDHVAGIHESVILSTCNRLEVYVMAGDVAGGFAAIEGFLADLQGLSVAQLHSHLYLLQDQPRSST